jgi:hypothetical protein
VARIRSIKPEFWDDEDLADLPRDARLLYIGTWNQADEHGRLRGNPKWIKGQVFPYDDDLDVDDIDRLLKLLDEHGKVVRYTVGGKAYMFLPNLDRHQRLEGSKVPSRRPSPDEADDQSARIRALGDDSRRPVGDSSPSFTPSSELHTDEAARGADEAALLYVAGSREQGAGTSASCAMQERSFTLVEPLTEPTYEVGSDEDPRWRDFWEAVPRKQGREDAREAWINHVLGKGTYKGKPIAKTEPDVMLNGMRAYAARIQRERIERQHIKMAQGWINGKRWEDEKAQPNEDPERQGVDLWA